MSNLSLRNTRGWLIFALDVIGLAIMFWLADAKLTNSHQGLILLIFIFSLFINRTYERNLNNGSPRLPIRTFVTCLLTGFLLVLLVSLFTTNTINNDLNKSLLALLTIAFGVVSTLNRYFLNKLYTHSEENKKILYLGYSIWTEELINQLTIKSESRHLNILTKEKKMVDSCFVSRLNMTFDGALQKQWHEIIIDPEHDTTPEETSTLVAQRLNGTPIFSLADYYERNWFMVQINNISSDWFLRSQGFSMLPNTISLLIRRLADIFLSLICLVVSLPLLISCGILIKLTSNGPIFFTQQRVGLNGKNFTIYKLRSMKVDAEANSIQWSQKDDSRITSIGNYLRKLRIDEIPQCLNIIKGEMSIIGPRPERPEFTSMLAKEIPYYDLRHVVKPGLTGWAQVSYPYGASTEDALRKLQFDLYYIKNQSPLLDLNIILRTMTIIFQRTGR